MACTFKYKGQWYTELELEDIYDKEVSLFMSGMQSYVPEEAEIGEDPKLAPDTLADASTFNQDKRRTINETKASPKTLKKVKEWLDRLGVDVKKLESSPNSAGVANLLEMVIEVAEGKEDIALTEEAFHFAVFIVRETNPALFKEMMNRIGKYNIYTETLALYRENAGYQNSNGTPNILKIKEEAIGKLLSEMYLKSEQGVTEHPELLQQAKTWWEKILSFFGILKSKAGFDPFEEVISSFDELADQSGPSQILARRIINALPNDSIYKSAFQDSFKNGYYKTIVTTLYEQLTDESVFGIAPYDQALKMLGGNEELARDIIALGNPYYQLTTEQKDKQQEIASRFDQKLVDFQVEKVTGKAEFDEQDDVNFYQRIKDGKVGKVGKRVTDFVKESKRPEVLAKFENATAVQKLIYKQKAAHGTAFHADAENIINASLTPEGYLKPYKDIVTTGIVANMPSAAFSVLQKYLIGYVENGEYIPGIMQVQFPEGTMFKTETIVYDERKGRDVAGTIDLMAITPEGKIMIYDWKTKFLDTQKYSDIPYFSQQDYKIQLSQYKTILRSYNIPADDVIVAQAMPIVFTGKTNPVSGDIKLTSVVFPEVDIKKETARYLLPVAIDEQSSGNAQVDEYIKALNRLHETLFKQKDLNKALKIEQLNAISGAIRELQVKQEFAPLAEQGAIFIKGAQRLIQDIKTNLKGEDGKFKPIENEEKLEEYRSRIKNVVDNIHKYISTHTVFKSIYDKESLTDEQKTTLQTLETLAIDAQDVESALKEDYANFVGTYYGTKEGLNLLKTEKPIRGVFDRTIQSLSRMQNVALQYLRKVTARANFQKQRKALAKQEEYSKLLDEFNEYAKAKGLSVRDRFSLLTDKNSRGEPTNKLLRKIKQEFYDEHAKATNRDSVDVEWIKENIDLEKWQEAKELDIERFNKQVDDSIYVIGDPAADNAEKTRKKEEYKVRFDISTPFSLGWLRDDLKYYIKDEAKWETDGYKAISGTPALINLYNFIISLNREAKEIGYHDATQQFSTRFLPWLRASTLDRIKSSGLSAVGDSIRSVYELTPEEEISYARTDPNTGMIEKTIPAFFTRNFAEKREDGTYDLSDVSTDIGETISMYIEAMYEYESLVDVEGAIKSVRDIEAGKGAFLLDSQGKIVSENNVFKKGLDNAENVALYDSFVDAILYKRQYSDQSNLSQGATKMIEKANHFFRLKVFGLNIFTPMTTFIGGNLQGLINSRKLYKGKEFLKNELKVIGNLFTPGKGEVEKGLMDYFLPFTENRARFNAQRMSLDKLQRWSFSDIVMSPIRKSDILIQLTTSLTVLDNTVLIDGQLVNAREYLLNSSEFRNRYKDAAVLKELERTFESRVKDLIEKHGIKNHAKFTKDGLLEIDGVGRDSETVNKLRLKILNEIRTITGNVTEENKIDADRNILLKSMMMFKRWIPPLATNRFGGLQKNVDTSQYEMGRARMVWQIIFNGDGGHVKGLIKGIKNLRDMAAGNAEGIKALAAYYERAATTYKNKTGNDLEMTPEEFYDMTRRAITQQAKELGVLLTMLSGFMAIKGAGVPDDEDEQTKNFYRVTLRMLDKLTDEISFYYNPLSLQQISTGSWMPSLGLLTDGIKFTNSLRKEGWAQLSGNEDMAEAAHPTKDFFQMIPLANQIFRTFIPLIDPEVAKDLGIQVSTESRRN